MSMDTLVQTDLSEQDREHLKASSDRWNATLRQGSHLQDWMAFLPDLQNGRKLSLAFATTNSIQHPSYKKAFGAFLRQWFPDMLATEASNILRLGEADHWDLLQVYFVKHPNKRHKINTPQSASKKVEEELAGPKLDKDASEDVRKEMPLPSEAALLASFNTRPVGQQAALYVDCDLVRAKDLADRILSEIKSRKLDARDEERGFVGKQRKPSKNDSVE